MDMSDREVHQLWCDEGFTLFKDWETGHSLRESANHLRVLLPHLDELGDLESRVTNYINAGVVKGLQHFLEDPLVTLCDYRVDGAGKILVDFYDDGPADLGHVVVDLQPDVDGLASGEIAEPDVMEAWATWFEDAAKKIRAGIEAAK